MTSFVWEHKAPFFKYYTVGQATNQSHIEQYNIIAGDIEHNKKKDEKKSKICKNKSRKGILLWMQMCRHFIEKGRGQDKGPSLN